MADQEPELRVHGNAYNIFILVLTVFSLVIMVGLILPFNQETHDLLFVYDNVIALIFLGDFIFNITGAKPKRAYFIGQRGWLDLLGSIPSLGITTLGGLLRLARLSRLARITRLMGGKRRAAIIKDVLDNRGQYATFITLLAAGLVLASASIIVLAFEAGAPGANIKTGGEALWWGLVTLTTVGYGDFFPVTMGGRITATFVMFAGVGIIGALASILASLLVAPSKSPDREPVEEGAASTGPVPADTVSAAPATVPAPAAVSQAGDVAEELAALRAEIADLRQTLIAERG
jgi:voltage-gated potassium channel